ncbi:asparagine synthase (glutamine-hydrolyzing) [Halobacteriovorax sp. HLS]|uniref:asparagine synthase (glutamine-hydrolyzing) n=1 Tax=Halobacteriovorax sp. HLS TaxID=2234000 RepID=UPI000FDA24DA|nr:asparagine synthase (glutamine-hydrolyzing) [Halobacteriovorax sp. HLS]
MCGIAGYVGSASKETLDRMISKVRYRGPDEINTHVSKVDSIHFAHSRLSILDITTGQQPMLDGDNVIVFNGEIYNYLELRNELVSLGHDFITDHSDTEVILKGYAQWGESVLNKLNGMFAFSLYDSKNKIVFFARDRFGQKPFFYSHGKSFVFSSELHSLCEHEEINPVVDKLSLAKYFAFNSIPAPSTIFKKIFKLPPGSYGILNLEKNSLSIKKYFSYKISEESMSYNEALRLYEDKLVSSTERHLRADVPIGLFLSGGIDSSTLAYIAKSKLSQELDSYSIGFDEKSFDESSFAKLVANELGLKHHHKVVKLEMVEDLISKIIPLMDEPMGDSSILPTYLLSEFASSSKKVCVGGDAADELFFGYDPFKALGAAKICSLILPKLTRKWIYKAIDYLLPVKHSNMSFDFKVRRFLRGLQYDSKFWGMMWMSSLDLSEINTLLEENYSLEDLFHESGGESRNEEEQLVDHFCSSYLPGNILTKVDRASMYNSLEVRAPFLDNELVEFSQRLPRNFKYNKGRTKFLLRDYLKSKLPESIVERPKKGFGVPMAKWLLNKEIFRFKNESQLLNKKFINDKIHMHRSLSENNKDFLWNLYVLENSFAGKYL